MSTGTRDLLLLVVALFAVAASAYYYVAGVLDNDRLLSRSSVVTFVLFGVLGVLLVARIL